MTSERGPSRARGAALRCDAGEELVEAAVVGKRVVLPARTYRVDRRSVSQTRRV